MVSVDCVVDNRAVLGESVIWDSRRQCLWWVDIVGETLFRLDPAIGVPQSWSLGEAPGCLALRRDGSLVLTTRSGFYFFDPKTGLRSPIADPEADKPDHRFNDGAVDRQGRFWAGAMKDRGDATDDSSFYRLDPDLRTHRTLTGFRITNGTAFSPDGKTLYLADTHRCVRTVWAFDYDIDDGTAHRRRVFFDMTDHPGRPDGAAVDADGCYWLAAIDSWSVLRLTPAGEIDRVIALPVQRPTKVAFGGSRLDTLYVTSSRLNLDPDKPQAHAGSLFAIAGLGVQGVPEPVFAG